MKSCYVVRNVDEDYEYVFALVAESPSDAKTRGMSLLECDYIEVRIKKHKEIDVNKLPFGEITDYLWALSKGLYGWVEEDCPRCKSKDERVQWDQGFFCGACEDDFYKVQKEGKR